MQNTEKLKSILSESLSSKLDGIERKGIEELDSLKSINREFDSIKQMLEEISRSLIERDPSPDRLRGNYIQKGVPGLDKELLSKSHIDEMAKSGRSLNEHGGSSTRKTLKPQRTTGILNNYISNANKLNRNSLKSMEKKEKSMTKDKSMSKMSTARNLWGIDDNTLPKSKTKNR